MHGMLHVISGNLFALNTIICTHYVIVRHLIGLQDVLGLWRLIRSIFKSERG